MTSVGLEKSEPGRRAGADAQGTCSERRCDAHSCALGIDVDTGAMPDYDVFFESLVAGFDEFPVGPEAAVSTSDQ